MPLTKTNVRQQERKLMSEARPEKVGIVWMLLLALIAVFPVFWQLGSTPIRLWDEARLAINAMEMSENGNVLVTYFDGVPDFWNTKPPFIIWFQAALMRIIGYNEMAMRLPSALAVLATFAVMFLFCLRFLKDFWAGVFCVMVLLTSTGYMSYHVARHGDYDAMLTLWMTSYTLLYYVYLERKQPKYFLLFAAALTLAALTKGVASLLPAPALLLYTLILGRVGWVLRQRAFYMGVAGFVLVLGTYYGLREIFTPGYWHIVHYNELTGRYTTGQYGNVNSTQWFLQMFYEHKFVPWVYLLPFSMLLLLVQPDNRLKRLMMLCLLFLACYFAVISTSETKLYWYDAPAFPIASMIVGIGLALVMKQVKQHVNINLPQAAFMFLVVVCLFWGPYNRLLNSYLSYKGIDPVENWPGYYGTTLKRLEKTEPERKEYTILRENRYNASLMFYERAYEKRGYNLTTIYPADVEGLLPQEAVIACDSVLSAQVEMLYHVKKLYTQNTCGAYLILQKK